MDNETNDPLENRLLRRGDRVELIRMGEGALHPLEPGATGTVTSVDVLGTIHVRWDNGRKLGLLPYADEYRKNRTTTNTKEN